MFGMINDAVEVAVSIAPQAITSTAAVNGTAVATANTLEDLLLHLNSGAASTADTLDFAVQESADGSTSWAAVPADALFSPTTGQAVTPTQVTDAGAVSQLIGIRKERVKPYVRVVATAAGSSISIVHTAVFILPRKVSQGW